jgi:BlaI family transcriptional regulator, penicillinase repressor
MTVSGNRQADCAEAEAANPVAAGRQQSSKPKALFAETAATSSARRPIRDTHSGRAPPIYPVPFASTKIAVDSTEVFVYHGRNRGGTMKKPARPRPTTAELAILRVLWQQGPSTVRDILKVLERARPTGYTTVLKTLQIMTTKGLVQRDERERSHVYAAASGERQMLRRIVGDLIDRACGGSAAKLVLHALEARRLSDSELSEIRTLLDEFEKKNAP